MLVKKCPGCGYDYDLSAVFCNRDGLRLEEVERVNDPNIGKVIRGCRILSRLGKGGMGTVYLAEHEELGLNRAVKVIHREIAPDPSSIERFRVEARAASRIEHPNVIRVYDFGKTEDNAFAMVMEFLAGESLADILKREKRLAPERAVSIAVEIARGLGAAHQLNIVHRDLKPDNVMILKNGQVKVVDFGIAKIIGAEKLTGNGNFIGTPHYASPEQAIGERDAIDKASDIFSLGVIAYEMLSGRLPYDCTGKTPFGILLDRVNGHPIPIDRALPEGVVIPELLSLAVMHGLAREPNDRPLTAAEFADELEAGLRPVETAPSPIMIFPTPLPQTFTNSIGMEFILIPAGKFLMGDGRVLKNEKPIHEVTIGNPFYLGKYQVRQGDWKKLTGMNPSKFTGNDQLPVDSVNWDDCQDFIRLLNNMEKSVVYRLPSEAEWEYACRAGTKGDFAGEMEEMGWSGKTFLGSLKNQIAGTGTHPVGLKKANDFGLYDMHGNVWEWCQDRWHGDYEGAPTDGSAWEEGINHERVLRGGSWGCHADSCQSAYRNSRSQTWRDGQNGLRLVMIPLRT